MTPDDIQDSAETPQAGGSYFRDPKTGRLVREEAPTDEAPAAPGPAKKKESR